MKKQSSIKPWYFFFTALSFVAKPILQWLVMHSFFDESAVEEWLKKSVSLSDIIPIAFFLIVLAICTCIYLFQKSKGKSEDVLPDERQALSSLLVDIMDKTPSVESMQAFQYVERNADGKKYYKLTYLAGSAIEGIEINTILQTYFYFPYALFKKMRRVSNLYSRYLSERDPILKDEDHNY